MPDEPGNTGTSEGTPPAGGAGGSAAGEPQLGPAGEKALAEERAARRTAEKAAKDATTALEAMQSKNMTEQERAVAEAKAAGRTEALGEANSRLVRAEIKVAAAGKLADPADAHAFLGDLDQFIDRKGDVDDKAITKAIDDLVKAKPYLAATGNKPGSADGGSRGGTSGGGGDMNQLIRDRMSGRR